MQNKLGLIKKNAKTTRIASLQNVEASVVRRVVRVSHVTDRNTGGSSRGGASDDAALNKPS